MKKSDPAPNYESLLEKLNPFGRYQIVQWILSMYGGIAVTGNMFFPVLSNIYPRWKCSANASFGRDCIEYSSCPNLTYETVEFQSPVHEFHLHCNKFIVAMLATSQMIGVLFGAAGFAQMADICGRKWAQWLSITGLILMGFASGFSLSWQMFMAFRALIGFFIGGYTVTSFVLITELVDHRNRLLVRSLGMWSCATCWFAILGYFCREWRLLSIVLNAQCAPLIIFYAFVLESPRWLLVQGGSWDRVQSTFTALARWNKAQPIDDSELIACREAMQQKRQIYSYWHLFSAKELRFKTITSLVIFFSLGTTSYGLLFSQQDLAGNKYANLFLIGAVGQALLLIPVFLDRCTKTPLLGRKLFACCSLAAICLCMIIVLVFRRLELPKEVTAQTNKYLTLIGTSVASVAWVMTHLFSAEIFPTVVRNLSNGLGSAAGRVGSIIAPFIAAFANDLWEGAGHLIFATLIGSSLILIIVFIPESKGRQMPDQIEDKRQSDAEANKKTVQRY